MTGGAVHLLAKGTTLSPRGNQAPAVSWQKARKSLANGSCVEVGRADGLIAVRDSKDPEGPVLHYTPAEWDAFLDGARKGEFDQG